MSNLAIKVENVSKAYTIWRDPAARLKHPFLNLTAELFPVLRPRIDKKMLGLCTEFYALRDVSFEVRKGESVGIIGRNGSGKSTLLQIIAGTLQPTEGSVTVNGRVAALLELGSGFNPEFTGRENVYLNCSILGLSKEETEARFDSIAAFADIGDFLEQPVKTYSSGMTMRLAFAVIAHVDADVLIVDEALAVGDAVFVQKCMRFIRGFQEKGTLLDRKSVV
jgi:lipopolysaccharide transport system ATP-binding protein